VAKRNAVLEIEGREVTISNPDKVFFPRTGHTKLDLVNYYLAVADGAIRGVRERLSVQPIATSGAEQLANLRSSATSTICGYLFSGLRTA